MDINWVAYYYQFDGYGRFNSRISKALIKQGVNVHNLTLDHTHMPEWMQQREGIDWSNLTISCMPPYLLRTLPTRHWLFTMLEGSVAPPEWVNKINASGVEMVIVPCEQNAQVFREGGVLVPVVVVPGGTDPEEFPLLTSPRPERPYTFLTLGDRGLRKGWEDVWKSFYLAFGGKTDGIKDVRLVIKYRSGKNAGLFEAMASAYGFDERIVFDGTDVENMYDVYAKADALVLPSRSEGWGMPHREAACMGLPVITQQYAGLDDGWTDQWSIPVGGTIQPIPKEHKPSLGEWMVPDQKQLAKAMNALYIYPSEFAGSAKIAAHWIRNNQTWEHSAKRLLEVIDGEETRGGVQVERSALYASVRTEG